jgi:hypothetical protein
MHGVPKLGNFTGVGRGPISEKFVSSPTRAREPPA